MLPQDEELCYRVASLGRLRIASLEPLQRKGAQAYYRGLGSFRGENVIAIAQGRLGREERHRITNKYTGAAAGELKNRAGSSLCTSRRKLNERPHTAAKVKL